MTEPATGRRRRTANLGGHQRVGAHQLLPLPCGARSRLVHGPQHLHRLGHHLPARTLLQVSG